jgi:hypothetical protein
MYISTLLAAGEKKIEGMRQKGTCYIHFYAARRRRNKIRNFFFSGKSARYTHFYTVCRIRKKIGVFCIYVKKVPGIHISTLRVEGEN